MPPAPLAPPGLAHTPPAPRLAQVQGQRPSPMVGWLARRVLDALCALPAPARDGLARSVGHLAFLLGIRRRVALDNLAHAFPEKSASERRGIAREAYLTMARVVIESMDPRDHLATDWLEPGEPVGDWAALQAHVASGRGALLVTAHAGNWERAGKLLPARGVPLNALVRPLKGAFNMRLVDNRVAAGVGLIYPKGAIAQVQEAVERGESVLMLLDQALPPQASLFVPFFGRLASTTPAMAVVAQRTRAPVFVLMGVRDPSGRKLRVEVEGPIPVPEGLEGQAALVAHTAAVTAVLERHIRRQPGQWLWLHRRWKTAPPPAVEVSRA